MPARIVVLGAGMTGLAAARASGGVAYEAEGAPGGICSSYYLAPGDARRRGAESRAPTYRFEIGGGHWLFGGDPATLALIESLTPARRYARRSSVYFPDEKLFVPYPLQYHLRHLGAEMAARALAEMRAGGAGAVTMGEWLAQSFGATLTERFFEPFHALYTGGLHARIAPQDGYKSPVDIEAAARGAVADGSPAGYNVTFLYPIDGLDALAGRLAASAHVEYGRRAVAIDAARRVVTFADGGRVAYDTLISTLPLNRALELAGLDAGPPDPHTSVLVLNVGALRGPRCPADHWIYVPRSRAGFHRIGFYSNVDPSFLPAAPRSAHPRASLYVERAYAGGGTPTPAEIDAYAAAVVRELQDWGFIGEVEVQDPTWIDVAYTWSWPGSRWREEALRRLTEVGVRQVGRYARWRFQGIADSLRDGLAEGQAALEASAAR